MSHSTLMANALKAASIRGVTGEQMLEAIGALEPPAPAESWQAGDVVRNGGNPDDKRAWAVWRDSFTPGEVVFFPVANPGGPPRRRDELPDRLTLIVRDGRPVLREPTRTELNAADLTYYKDGEYFDVEEGLLRVSRLLDTRRGVIRP